VLYRGFTMGIINNILGNKATFIPHQCAICGKQDLYYIGDERNYLYHNGNYYHTECFMHKPKRGRRK
jgi:hypothetical protein